MTYFPFLTITIKKNTLYLVYLLQLHSGLNQLHVNSSIIFWCKLNTIVELSFPTSSFLLNELVNFADYKVLRNFCFAYMMHIMYASQILKILRNFCFVYMMHISFIHSFSTSQPLRGCGGLEPISASWREGRYTPDKSPIHCRADIQRNNHPHSFPHTGNLE